MPKQRVTRVELMPAWLSLLGLMALTRRKATLGPCCWSPRVSEWLRSCPTFDNSLEAITCVPFEGGKFHLIWQLKRTNLELGSERWLTFRLLDLLLCQRDEPIRCTTHHSSLAMRPRFYAVSYCWGPACDIEDVRTNGKLSSVQSNLYRFLIEVRLLDRPPRTVRKRILRPLPWH